MLLIIGNGRFNEKDNEVHLLWSKMAASFCSARDMSYGFVSRKCYASYGRAGHTTFKEIRKKKMPQISNKIRTTNNKVSPTKKVQMPRPLISFYTAVVIEFLVSLPVIDADVVKRILPYVVSLL
ncbi:hypothetical protein L1987_11150 [Smallanthus sonchifolius]|uniref:Uncharacterized protein n=1 Tax=Smallanthus sonchifolius TaxID=185202 RepID=A0ACB9JC81_9ASTR|nr:hypothetical protein L1987_11150 [Smallanthus sonchifolius]